MFVVALAFSRFFFFVFSCFCVVGVFSRCFLMFVCYSLCFGVSRCFAFVGFSRIGFGILMYFRLSPFKGQAIGRNN